MPSKIFSLILPNERVVSMGFLMVFQNRSAGSMINLMVSEANKTSEIEEEYLNQKDVMSSIRRNLGLNTELPVSKDKRVDEVSTKRF
ncbi:MAG: DUF4172 domain-containing protein [Flavobacteriaceae bacterium]